MDKLSHKHFNKNNIKYIWFEIEIAHLNTLKNIILKFSITAHKNKQNLINFVYYSR